MFMPRAGPVPSWPRPSAWLIERAGYRTSLVLGLVIMAAGALGTGAVILVAATHRSSHEAPVPVSAPEPISAPRHA